MNRFPCLRLEGGLIGSDLVDQIADGTAAGQRAADFDVAGRHLTDEIAAAWSAARAYWALFQQGLGRLDERDAATSLTRDRWLSPLLSALGYGLDYTPRAAEVDGKSYALSHRLLPAGDGRDRPEGDAVPLHLVGCRQSLDRRPESGATRLAPHSLMQEYLNRTEHLWGLISNGYTCRLLRNSLLLRRVSYVELDLRQMMEGDHFADFALFYRLLHRSRLPQGVDDAPNCLLEAYHRQTVEQGGRVRDRLRDGVEDALRQLANGLLAHPESAELRRRLQTGELRPESFYQQLLRLVYRLLFLMVAEERGLIGGGLLYQAHYSVSRLRRLAELRSAYNRQHDAWLGLQTTFALLREEKPAAELGLAALNGNLFAPDYTGDLNAGVALTNQELLGAIWSLSMYRETEGSPWRRVNYAALDVEELGSVYESLLEYHPLLLPAGGRLRFELGAGSQRKTTGSYYTPPELVQELIRTALEPVIADRLQAVERTHRGARRDELRKLKEESLLSMAVCDPASGSGHFLLAAARRLGRELAQVRAGEDELSPENLRTAVRQVIARCIYAVDKNPLAVDLCKVALWIEGHAAGKPLTFLDDRVRWGDSLVGVLDLAALDRGIPDEAYTPLGDDDRVAARDAGKRNRPERAGQLGLDMGRAPDTADAVEARRALLALPDDTPDQVRQKERLHDQWRKKGGAWWQQQTACHLWTAAFFQRYAPGQPVITTDAVRRQARSGTADGRLVGTAWPLALELDHPFFHWPLEFPEVWARGGFDVVLCNPPWEHTELKEKEWFSVRRPEIAEANTGAVRKQMIQALSDQDPALYAQFVEAKRAHDNISRFVRGSGRHPLCGCGRINTYAVFAELVRQLVNPAGRVGAVVPTGIATDDTTKFYFQDLMDRAALVSLYDFENRQKIFPAVDSRMKFCLLTLAGAARPAPAADLVFFAQGVEDLRDPERRFSLGAADIALLNPNTRTCPIFRSQRDAELTKAIYRRVPVLVREGPPEENPWGITFRQGLFNMTSDSGLFSTREQLEREGWQRVGNRFLRGGAVYLPLYEAKMMHHFDHRWATYEGTDTREVTLAEKQDPHFVVLPRYWVPQAEVDGQLADPNLGWLVGFRDIARSTDERTAIFSILPRAAVGHTCPLAFVQPKAADGAAMLVAGIVGQAFDYVTRQKVGGTHLTYGYLKQLPALPPATYREPCSWAGGASRITYHGFLLPRILELTYTAYDLQPFARDCNYDGPPFRWDEERRFRLRCELDAAYFHLYGIERDGVDYILETFPIVKRKDEAAHGEYRTKRVILEIYDAMARAAASGAAYPTRLDPPPADPRAAHPWDEAYLGPERPPETWWRESHAEPAGPPTVAPPKPARDRRASPTDQRHERPAVPEPAAVTAAPALTAADLGQARPRPAPGRRRTRSATAELSRTTAEATPAEEQAQAAPRPPAFVPLAGSDAERRSQVLALGRQDSPQAVHALIGALADPDNAIRWLASSSLYLLGTREVARSPTFDKSSVSSALEAYLAQCTDPTGRAAAEKLLGRLGQGQTRDV